MSDTRESERKEIEGRGGLRIRFVDDDVGALIAIELESPRSEPVVADVHQALFAIGVLVAGIEVAVRGDAIVERLLVSERDGSALTAARHLEVQIEVMEVVQRRLVESLRPGPASARPASGIHEVVPSRAAS